MTTPMSHHAPATPGRLLDGLGLAVLVAQLIVSVISLPVAAGTPLEPPSLATFAGALSSLAILALRLRGQRGTRHEHRIIVAFLAAMPFVYVASWWRQPEPGWLPIELLGVLVYVSLAIAGARRSPWLLALGILLHGGWDALHHGRTVFVPDWYADGCLVVDLGMSLYVAVECWRGSWRRFYQPAPRRA